MPLIAPSRRVRRTPFSDGIEAAGVQDYTVYNRMLPPKMFRSVEEDYHHLKSAVQLWDVACERQAHVKGPDARALLDILTPRDLSILTPDRALYVPICDRHGGMPPFDRAWPLIHDGARVGQVTSSALSPDFGTNVAIGMVRVDHWDAGTGLVAETQTGPFDAVIQEKFWI